jgi:hypothetical protein
MTPGRIVMTIVGVLLAMLGLAVAMSGGGLLWLNAQRDAGGYLNSPTFELRSDGRAITGEDALFLEPDPGTDYLPWVDQLEVRIEVPAAASEVFVGLADADEVDRYLDGVAHEEVTDLLPGADSRTRPVPGERVPEPPAEALAWSASAEGAAPTTLTWRPEPGRWSVVVMNADADPGVEVDVRAGVRTGSLVAGALALLIVGSVLFLGGVALVVGGLAGVERRPPTAVAPPAGAVPAEAPGAVPAGTAGAVPAATGPGRPVGPYPLALRAQLDPELSRWQWLVKWLLVIPHVIVLAALFTAYAVVTVLAFFAILFTARYPRPLFDFNVGVLRWAWRVSYYSYGANGTDRYPPFSLEAGGYPADLDVVYPERLSRGLVLVKWWLLAIPHYLIVAVLTGGGLSWTLDGGGDAGEAWRLSFGGGLVGILVLIAVVVLLVRAHYPPRLFDLIVGCQRWAFRVAAYATLMTDVYPPFRLDLGGEEPPVAPPPPSGPSGPPATTLPPREPVAH